MTHARKKSPPGQAAGIEGKATEDAFRMKEQEKATAAPVRAVLREFPANPAPDTFAYLAKEVMTAKTHEALCKAIVKYAFCVAWARRQTGRGFDLAQIVVAGNVQRYASFSPVRPRLRKRAIAYIVARMDEAARVEVEGRDA